MTPLIVLVGAFLVFLLLGRIGVPPLRDRGVTPLRWALAVMFLVTASAHWGDMRPDLVRMVPPGIPEPELMVTVTGLAEIAGAIGLVVPRLAPFAAGGLALLLAAVFPANVNAAIEGLSIDGTRVLDVAPRALIQLGFLVAVLVAGFGPRWRKRPAPQTTVA